jgi:hypothetical protein
MTETQPPPGSREAIGLGCTCTREGWNWITAACVVHDHSPAIIPQGRGLCERHGNPTVERGMCTECLDGEAGHREFMRDMRSIHPREY